MSEILSQKITNFSGQKIGNIKKKCQKKNKSRLKSTFFDIFLIFPIFWSYWKTLSKKKKKGNIKKKCQKKYKPRLKISF